MGGSALSATLLTTANWRGAIHILEGGPTIQRVLDRLEQWTDWNLTKFSKRKGKVSHFGWSAPAKARS